MSKDLVIAGQEYTALVDELLALKTEQGYDMAVRGLEWAHQWGKTIRDYYPKDAHPVGRNQEDGVGKALNRLSLDVGRTKRMLWMYIKLYDTYPDLELALSQHGKNVSMRKLLDTPDDEKKLESHLDKLVKSLENFLQEVDDEEAEKVMEVIAIIKRRL